MGGFIRGREKCLSPCSPPEERPREERAWKWPFEKPGREFSLGIKLASALILDFPVSRTVRKWGSAVEAIQAIVFCYGSLSWLIQNLEVKRLWIFRESACKWHSRKRRSESVHSELEWRNVIAGRGFSNHVPQNSQITDEETKAHRGQVICLRSFRD